MGFSALVCVVCALFVAGSAVSLRERQELNILIDRQKNVLTVAGLMKPGESLSASELTSLFDESIRSKVIDLATGAANDSIDPNSFDQRAAARDPSTSTLAPANPSKVIRLPNQALVYEVIENDEVDAIILPIEGMGLWSILYGYIALQADATTILGITYYEQGETAGLGGEVDNPRWKAKWPGRKAFNERGVVKIQVAKGAAGPPDVDPYRVDGLAGATITSRGVTNMLRFWLGDEGFGPYLAKYRDQLASKGT
jgi:Na+-transporting NADH:ubiquinone oxidoreductase subunit C